MAVADQAFLLFSFIFITTLPMTSYSISEAEALLNLKNSFSNGEAQLNSWVANSIPCTEGVQWEGVICDNVFVTGIRLEGKGLLGKIDVDALLELKRLRTISLINNSLSGSIPELNRIGFLKTIYLSGNKFSGDIPPDYFQRMRSLKKLWLANNEFTGQIPSSVAEIPQLMELHLENNQFIGRIPNIDNPSLVDIDVSNNKLEGEIPPSLLRFPERSFARNSGLCGEKLGKTCEKKVMDQQTQNNNAEMSSVVHGNVSDSNNDSSNKSSSLRIAAYVVASIALLSLVVLFIVRTRRKNEEEEEEDEDFDEEGKENNNEESSVEVQVSAPVRREVEPVIRSKPATIRKASTHSKGELMIVNDEKGFFGLVDLMRASAEVLGNVGFGSSYKAVMANGVAVVVKRMREMNAMGKDCFDAEMRKLGRLKHWNILTPLAYLYRKEEKLVVYEYVPKGSLLYLLHGDRGPSHAELDWQARLKIVRGIAEGMRYLHKELGSPDLVHGNLKSSNILLGPGYEPLLTDYGFSPLLNPAIVSQALFAYKAPETAQGQVSRKSDVYCLGVVILEILTGKYPSQYLSNGKGGTDVVQWVASAVSESGGRESELLDPEIASSRNSLGEMVQLLHIGAACTESDPQKRLDLAEAIRRIEEINGDRESGKIEVLLDSQGHGDEQSRRRHETKS